VQPNTFTRDRLGKQVYSDELLLQHHTSLSDFIRTRRGASNISSTLSGLHHPAQHLIRHLSHNGFPVVMTTPPWTDTQRDLAVHRGPHSSSREHITFLRDELADMVERATWLVLPYSKLRHLSRLRISPMGVVPQHERRPRPIVDYTFSGVNADTVGLAPREAMQFGHTLERLLSQVVHANPKFGPVHFFKLDIADGFYRVWLRAEDVPILAVSIPALPGEPPLLALPLALPMGWTQSPPAFCAVTETITDHANALLHKRRRFPNPHRLDLLANTLAPTPLPALNASRPLLARDPNIRPYALPLRAVDIFVDDFIGVAQGSPQSLLNTRRTVMHAIDAVLRPLHPGIDPPHRTEPISTSKLAKGDGSWSTTKQLLGWTINSADMTITLPPRRLQRLADLLASIPANQKRLSLSTWHSLLGELRSMSLALPGSRGLFSHLQAAIRTRDGTRLRLTPAFHGALADFDWIRSTLAQRPTRLFELVPTTPSLVGAHDASGHGAGGVWFAPSAGNRSAAVYQDPAGDPLHAWPRDAPIVWRTTFPPDVIARLCTHDNPRGDLNNSELELAGAYLQQEVAAQCFDVRERTIKSATDNLATLYWTRRGSVTTTSPTATLLRQSAMHQRFHRYLSLKDYVPGRDNVLADDASRLSHLSDSAFLSHFNVTYPQKQPWLLYHLPSATLSSAISALRNKMSPLASFLLPPAPLQAIGPSGQPSARPSGSILPFARSRTLSPTSKCLPFDTGADTSTPQDVLSVVAPWKVPYGVLARRSRQWGPRIHVSRPKAKQTSAFVGCSKVKSRPTHHLLASNRSQYPSSNMSWPKPSSPPTLSPSPWPT
jgi:hypothetical protein